LALSLYQRVRILNGVATEADNARCSYSHKPPKCADCPYHAVRPIESLNQEIEHGEGDSMELWETLADDRAIDLDAWVDARTWLLSCPRRLVEIAVKRVNGEALESADRLYLSKWQRKAQKRLAI